MAPEQDSPQEQEAPRRAGVQFVVSASEIPAFDYAGPRVVGPANVRLIAAPVNPDWEPIPGGNPSLEIYVEALDAEEAQAKAEEMYGQMRREGGLPIAGPRVTGLFWYTDKDPLWLLHFDEAHDLLSQQRYEMAVVTAQVACEIEIRAAVKNATNAPDGSLARIAIDSPRSYSLIDSRAQAIFKALLGEDPKQQQCWRDYSDHVARRNNVLHAGARVTREDALASIVAAEEWSIGFSALRIVKRVNDMLAGCIHSVGPTSNDCSRGPIDLGVRAQRNRGGQDWLCLKVMRIWSSRSSQAWNPACRPKRS